MAVNPGGSLVRRRFEVLLQYVLETVGALEKRVVSKVRWHNGQGGNFFGLVLNAPGAAKSGKNAITSSGGVTAGGLLSIAASNRNRV